MNKKDLEHFTRLILEERRRKLYSLGRTQGTLDEINDARAAEYEEEVSLSDDKEYLNKLIEHDSRGLEEINRALAKIIDGTYGICEMTGEPIKRERLEAIPTARYSLEAQQQIDEGAVPAPNFQRQERVARINLPGEEESESEDLATASDED
jgi:RNA polymerase-binding protein DksA